MILTLTIEGVTVEVDSVPNAADTRILDAYHVTLAAPNRPGQAQPPLPVLTRKDLALRLAGHLASQCVSLVKEVEGRRAAQTVASNAIKQKVTEVDAAMPVSVKEKK